VSTVPLVSCEGAPRDLGFDQGRACRDEIRADVGAFAGVWRRPWLRRLFREPLVGFDARLARDVARHFPHLDERIAGLADGAGRPREELLALAALEVFSTICARARLDPATGGLELAWPHAAPPTGFVARAARPDGGYANLTITRPGLAFALAGVNDHGLAGVVQAGRWANQGDRWHAPASLLLDQCIERLDTVEKALEWCERRPGGGTALLLFRDAAGACGAIEVDGEKRSRVEPPSEPRDREDEGPLVRVDAAARAIAVGGGRVEPARFALDQGEGGAGFSPSR
jgi:hypothetical protein